MVCCTTVPIPDSDAAGQHTLKGFPVESGEDGCNIINWVGVILSIRDCYIELSRHPVAIMVSQIINCAKYFILAVNLQIGLMRQICGTHNELNFHKLVSLL